MRTWLNGQTSPEMLYLETKWASLIPFARATDLLKEVLPVGDLVNAETIRNHLQLTAERIEQELGEERQLNQFEGSEQEWERQPLPDGPITVGIDGGYVRAAHKQGWFEVNAGKSVVAFRRDPFALTDAQKWSSGGTRFSGIDFIEGAKRKRRDIPAMSQTAGPCL